MKPKFVIAYPFGGRPLACDWHMAVRSLQLPSNTNIREICRRSYIKNGKYTLPIAQAQTELAEQAVEMGAEYILFIEDDTIPPPGVLMELSRVLEGSDDSVMSCGGIYTTRTYPPEPIVYMGPGQGSHWNWRLGDIFQCWATGMGCTMIRTKIFRMMSKPWFKELTSIEEVREYPELFPDMDDNSVPVRRAGCSSDLFFFTKLAQMGFKHLAHGGVLPIHWDIEKNHGFWLPKNTPPTQGVTYNGIEFGWTDPNLEIKEEVKCQA